MDKIRTTVAWGKGINWDNRKDWRKQKYSCKCGAHDFIKYTDRCKFKLPPVINC